MARPSAQHLGNPKGRPDVKLFVAALDIGVRVILCFASYRPPGFIPAPAWPASLGFQSIRHPDFR